MTKDAPQPLKRAKLHNRFVDYPHQDLANAAHFFLAKINAGFDGNERPDGLFLYMIATIAMTAFTLEGYVEFLSGRILGGNADERGSVKDRIKANLKVLDVTVDWNKRPYSTVSKLKVARDTFAHPKKHDASPQEWTAEGTDADFKQALRDHRPEYEKLLTQEFVNEAFNDVEEIWHQILNAAKIPLHDTWSGGDQGFEVLEHGRDGT